MAVSVDGQFRHKMKYPPVGAEKDVMCHDPWLRHVLGHHGDDIDSGNGIPLIINSEPNDDTGVVALVGYMVGVENPGHKMIFELCDIDGPFVERPYLPERKAVRIRRRCHETDDTQYYAQHMVNFHNEFPLSLFVLLSINVLFTP